MMQVMHYFALSLIYGVISLSYAYAGDDAFNLDAARYKAVWHGAWLTNGAGAISDTSTTMDERTVLDSAKALFGAGNAQKAYAFLKYHAEKGEVASLHHALGSIASALGMYMEAEAHYFRSAEIDSAYAASFSELAYLNIRKGDQVMAEYYARKAIAIEARHSDALWHLGTALALQQKMVEADSVLQVLALSDPVKLTDIGIRLSASADGHASAAYYFMLVYDKHPDLHINTLNLGNLVRVKGELKSALGYLEPVYKSIPVSDKLFGMSYASYFSLLLQMGRYKAVIKAAGDRVPAQYKYQYFFRAMAYYKNGQQKHWKKELARFLELGKEPIPDNLELWMAEKALNF